MLTQNGMHNNSTTYQPYPTDREAVSIANYEPTPSVDTVSQPKWRDQWPMFTHNVSWVDTDAKQHSLTIRTDDADELFGILRAIKHIVRQSKEKATETASQQAEPPAADTPDVVRCEIHGANMPRRWSKRTNGHYFAHKLDDGSFCYGKVKV